MLVCLFSLASIRIEWIFGGALDDYKDFLHIFWQLYWSLALDLWAAIKINFT